MRILYDGQIYSMQTAGGVKVLKCLAPYDSVINHFPESSAELRSRFSQALTRKFGRAITSALLRISWAEELYRRRLSNASDIPGRLYSFLCRKESES